MAIKEGYTVEGNKDAEDLIALSKRRAENARSSAIAYQKAAEAQIQDMRINPQVQLSQPTVGYGPGVPGASGPLKLPKSVYDGIKEKGKTVLKEMGVDDVDLK